VWTFVSKEYPVVIIVGTVLCSVVMVNRRNVSCQTHDYDDELLLDKKFVGDV